MVQKAGNKIIKILIFFIALVVILLAGSSLFRRSSLKEAERKLSAVEKRLDTVILQLETSRLKIDTLEALISRTSLEIGRLKTQVGSIDQDFHKNQKASGLRLDELKTRLKSEQDKLSALQEELRKLK